MCTIAVCIPPYTWRRQKWYARYKQTNYVQIQWIIIHSKLAQQKRKKNPDSLLYLPIGRPCIKQFIKCVARSESPKDLCQFSINKAIWNGVTIYFPHHHTPFLCTSHTHTHTHTARAKADKKAQPIASSSKCINYKVSICLRQWRRRAEVVSP